jgi:hypothetical protein
VAAAITRSGSAAKARGPMTGLAGLESTSTTGAKSRLMPSEASSRPIAAPTAAA